MRCSHRNVRSILVTLSYEPNTSTIDPRRIENTRNKYWSQWMEGHSSSYEKFKPAYFRHMGSWHKSKHVDHSIILFWTQTKQVMRATIGRITNHKINLTERISVGNPNTSATATPSPESSNENY